jgi:hypothetical protein
MMRVSRFVGGLCLLLSASMLGGCESVANALGLSRSSPDEFQVVPRAPLEQPPDYNLRPPAPGSPRPQELQREQSASSTVFGGASGVGAAAAGQSAGEQLLLQQAGADQAERDIRAIVDRENPGVVVGDRSFLDRLMFWQAEGGKPDPAVNAPAEAQRLQQEKAAPAK